MVHVVSFVAQIGDRELQLMSRYPAFVVGGNELEPRRQIKKNVGRLRDEQISRPEKRRRVGLQALGFTHGLHQRLDAATFAFGLARNIDVRSPGLLERQSNELAATEDRWPIEKFVASACHVPR